MSRDQNKEEIFNKIRSVLAKGKVPNDSTININSTPVQSSIPLPSTQPNKYKQEFQSYPTNPPPESFITVPNVITELKIPRILFFFGISISIVVLMGLIVGGIFIHGTINEFKAHHDLYLQSGTEISSNHHLVKHNSEFLKRTASNDLLNDLSHKKYLSKRNSNTNIDHDKHNDEEDEDNDKENDLDKFKNQDNQDTFYEQMFVQVLDTETLYSLFSNQKQKDLTLPSKSKIGQCQNKNLIFKTFKLLPKLDSCKPIKSSLDISTCCAITTQDNTMVHVCKDNSPIILDMNQTVVSFCLSCNAFLKYEDNNTWWMTIGLSRDYVNFTLNNINSQSECIIKINAICVGYFSFGSFFFRLNFIFTNRH